MEAACSDLSFPGSGYRSKQQRRTAESDVGETPEHKRQQTPKEATAAVVKATMADPRPNLKVLVICERIRFDDSNTYRSISLREVCIADASKMAAPEPFSPSLQVYYMTAIRIVSRILPFLFRTCGKPCRNEEDFWISRVTTVTKEGLPAKMLAFPRSYAGSRETGGPEKSPPPITELNFHEPGNRPQCRERRCCT